MVVMAQSLRERFCPTRYPQRDLCSIQGWWTTTVFWRSSRPRPLPVAAAAVLTLVLGGCSSTDSWVDATPAAGWSAQYADASNTSYTATAGAEALTLGWTRS